MAGISLRRLVVLAAAAALAIGLSGCTALMSTDATAASSCPEAAAMPVSTGLPGASTSLVPFVPSRVLLCKYAAAQFHKAVASRTLSGSAARSMAREFNSAVSAMPGTPLHCPALLGASVVAYFSNAQDRITVRVHSDGCQTADNGTQTRAWVASAFLGSRLAKLIHD